MITASKIVSLATGQLGVKESPPGSNNVKYNTRYYGHAVSGSAYPWCCAFIWWLFDELNANNLFFGGAKTASCTAVMRYAKSHGLWVTKNYRKGDLILYNWKGKTTEADHIGICVEATDAGVICIEGNTSLSSNDNGGCVMKRSRKYNVVIGAYRPNYVSETKVTLGGAYTKKEETVKVELPVLRKGDKRAEVRAMQALLNGFGFNCGKVDGSFGPATKTALEKYQTAKNLAPDGICGPATWSTLLKGI